MGQRHRSILLLSGPPPGFAVHGQGHHQPRPRHHLRHRRRHRVSDCTVFSFFVFSPFFLFCFVLFCFRGKLGLLPFRVFRLLGQNRLFTDGLISFVGPVGSVEMKEGTSQGLARSSPNSYSRLGPGSQAREGGYQKLEERRQDRGHRHLPRRSSIHGVLQGPRAPRRSSSLGDQ